jgi:hypothetical protein
MKRRAFIGLGATSVGVGALYGTGAFSSVNAGRGVSINTAQDKDALVSLDVADSVASNNDGERLYTVTNKFEVELSVTTTLTGEAADDDTITLVNHEITVRSGDSEEVLVDLSEPNPDTEEITFDIDTSTDTGASVNLSRGPVNISNPGGGGGGDGPANFAADDLVPDNGTFTQDLSFSTDALKSQDDVTIDLSEAQTTGADYSMASVEIIEGPRASTLGFVTETYEVTYSPQNSSASGTLTIRISSIEVDGEGGTVTATYDDTQDRTDEDTFSVAQDKDALVSLDVADSVASNNDGERLYTVTNKFEVELSVTTTLTGEAADDDTITLVNHEITVRSGDSEEVLVDLSEPNPDTEEITFDIDTSTDTGASVNLSRGPVNISNPGGGGGGDGPANFAADDLVPDNGTFTQDLSFSTDALKSQDDVTIDLSEAQTTGADYSMASVEIIEGPRASTLGFVTETYEVTYSPQNSSASGTLTIRISSIEVDGEGGTVTATYDDTQDRTDEDTFSVPTV